MAVFTAISAWAASSLAFMGAGGISFLGLSPALTSAVFAVGRSVTWALASAALNRTEVPRQEVQANIQQTDGPRIRAYGRVLLGGQRALWETSDGNLYQIILCHHGRVDELVQFWVDGEKVEVNPTGGVTSEPFDTGGSNPDLRLLFRDGNGEGGDYQPIRDAVSVWTVQHKLMGQATVGAILNHPGPERFGKVFPKGPHTLIQAEVRASLVRNGSGTLVYSENPAWCIRDYLTHRDGWRIPTQWIDDASFAAFGSLCDQPVALKAGGTEPRYRLSGHYALSDAPKDVVGRMLATCDGQVYMTAEGKIGILGGEWTEPDVVITSDDILEFEAADGFDPFTDFNVLKGKFTSPAHGYQPTEVPERRDAAALVTEPERVETIEIDMCPSGTQMQRLLKIEFFKQRRDIEGTMTTNLVGLKARFPKGRGKHLIRVVAPEFGLNRVFEVTSHSFSVPDGRCVIGIASLANPYGWNPATEEQALPVERASLTHESNGAMAPTGAALTQIPVRVSGDTWGGKLRLTVNAVTRNDLRLQAQIAHGNVPADSLVQWTEMGGDRFSAETGILANEQTYTVRYRWRGQATWQKAGSVTIIANPNVPAAPTGFVRVGSTGVSLKWTNPDDNFWKSRLFRGTTTRFADASFVKDVAGLAGQESTATDTPAAGTWRYWVVAMNGSSVASLPAGPVTITI